MVGTGEAIGGSPEAQRASVEIRLKIAGAEQSSTSVSAC